MDDNPWTCISQAIDGTMQTRHDVTMSRCHNDKMSLSTLVCIINE